MAHAIAGAAAASGIALTLMPVLYAYGNSRGDRRMLRGATFPFDVGRLGPLGALRLFPRLKRSEAEATAAE